jgi:hypothetical protein
VIACVQNTVDDDDDDDGKGETGSILLSSDSGLSAVVIILCVMMMLLAAHKLCQKYYVYCEIILSYCCTACWVGLIIWSDVSCLSLESLWFIVMVHAGW